MFELSLPNVLTMLRVLLVPVLVAALLAEGPNGDLLAAVIFVVASVTDALDGYIARKRRSESAFGKLMDPLADKLLITAALVALVSLDRVAAWVAMVIIAREFAVTGLRQIAVEQGHVIPASQWGKAKTTMQVAMVLCLIAIDGSPYWVDYLVLATVAVTVLSGTDYFINFRRLLREPSASGASSPDRADAPAPVGAPTPPAQPRASSQSRMET